VQINTKGIPDLFMFEGFWGLISRGKTKAAFSFHLQVTYGNAPRDSRDLGVMMAFVVESSRFVENRIVCL
jgi:hypothetical protein